MPATMDAARVTPSYGSSGAVSSTRSPWSERSRSASLAVGAVAMRPTLERVSDPSHSGVAVSLPVATALDELDEERVRLALASDGGRRSVPR